MKVKELLTDESKWAKGEWAKDARGCCCSYTSERAVCFCLGGAIARCYGIKLGQQIFADQEIYKRVATFLHLGILTISQWNDDKTRTFDDIKKVVEELDI